MAFDDVTRIEIVAGRQGMWGVANANLVPLGGLLRLWNASLEDQSWRTAPGMLRVTWTPITFVRAILDFWPDPGSRRTIAATSNGNIYSYPGDVTLASWSTIASGLSVEPADSAISYPPLLTVAGAESFERPRKVFYADGRNTPRVLAGSAASMSLIASPSSDWTGSTQPRFFVSHQGYNWAGGNLNSPHTVYRSPSTDHEQFNSSDSNVKRFILGPESTEEFVVTAASFKGGLVAWKYPTGVYFIDTTTETNADNWFPKRIGDAGIAGPRCWTFFGNDLLWAAPDGSWHILSAVQAKGDMAARGISFPALTAFMTQEINRAALNSADLVYYPKRQRAILKCFAINQTADSERTYGVVLDLGPGAEPALNWHIWTYTNDLSYPVFGNALYMRRHEGEMVPAVACTTNVGVYVLERDDRRIDDNGLGQIGQGYRFEWWLRDTDLAQVVPAWAGRKKNLWFLQMEYVPTADFTHTVEVWIDGSLKQTITMTFEAADPTLPVTLPFTLTPAMLKTTPLRKLNGQATRLALRGYTTSATVDTHITKVILGASLAA